MVHRTRSFSERVGMPKRIGHILLGREHGIGEFHTFGQSAGQGGRKGAPSSVSVRSENLFTFEHSALGIAAEQQHVARLLEMAASYDHVFCPKLNEFGGGGLHVFEV